MSDDVEIKVDGEVVAPKPFTKGYKATPEQLAKMKAGRERAAAERDTSKAKGPFGSLFKGGSPTAEPTVAPRGPGRPKKEQPSLTGVDKQVLVDALQMLNVALDLTGAGYTVPPDARVLNADGSLSPHPLAGRSIYSLEKVEIEQLATAWFEIAKRYPVFGSFLVSGRTVSVWGNALFVSYVVVGKRIAIADTLAKQRRGTGPPASAGPAAPGSARATGGDNGLGENGPIPAAAL